MRSLLLTRPPYRFLRWKPIRATMNTSGAAYIPLELAELQADPAWRTRWSKVLGENRTGSPQRGPRGARASSANLIHHLYHLMHYERATGLCVSDHRTIIEIGGGYGSLARLLLRLGFRGRLHIHDLPEFGALQRFYLTSVMEEEANLHVDDLSFSDSAGDAPRDSDLVIATWSLSESPVGVRDELMTVLGGASSYLFAYQHAFEGIDNRAWFGQFAGERSRYRWTDRDIPHLPGNSYLFGRLSPRSL